jgi:hypothetical protein
VLCGAGAADPTFAPGCVSPGVFVFVRAAEGWALYPTLGPVAEGTSAGGATEFVAFAPGAALGSEAGG